MKVLFAVSNENISESIIKKYQQMYKEIISSKNVYYFNAILKELQKDKTYDRIVISEDLEPFTNNNHDTIDNFIFDKLDSISDEAFNTTGEDIPIILIANDRRTKSDNLLVKIFGIGVYSALIGQDRSIEKVCNLINKPRTKKEAKIYYQVDSNEVGYKPENEGNVEETEIQNILNYYKRLGKNEERYVEVFDSISSQYTDQQLKVIIKFLPLNVKAVLEEKSTRYQQLTSYPGAWKAEKKAEGLNNYKQRQEKLEKANNENKSGIKVESILGKESHKKLTKPVIIPSAVSTQNVKKIQSKKEELPNVQTSIPEKIDEIFDKEEVNDRKEEIKEVEIPEIEMKEIVEKTEEPVKRKRGRPRKVETTQSSESKVVDAENNLGEETPKRKRGRPRKVVKEDEIKENILPGFESLDEGTMLPGFEEKIEDTVLPGFEEEQEDILLPGIEEKNEDMLLPGFTEVENKEKEDIILPGFEETNDRQYNTSNTENQTHIEEQPINQNRQEVNRKPRYEDLINYGPANSSSSIYNSSQSKVVAFIGTSKNGTSFLVNNLAEMLSNQGIKTAILDLTQNKNAYYIYTKNEEELRKTSYECIEKLIRKETKGIRVNKNLDVYTSLPGENNNIGQYETILDTLQKNYSLVLLDCDFDTNYGYFGQSHEIYLVQSMDVLTIQPLTAFLRELKAKGILDPNKIKIVLNKYVKVKSVTDRAIIGGMAFYNDPAMSFMTELFNKDKVKYELIPFDMQVYSKYLEGLVNCNITINSYPKEFVNYLRKLANIVYPLIAKNDGFKKINNTTYNNYQNTFSNDMNNTLNKMKNNY